jgi:hypothetical protein
MKAKNIPSVICLAIIFLFASGAWAADWILFNTPDEGKAYYDKSSIKKVSNNIIRVWTKTILNKDGKKKYFSFLQRINEAPDKPDILNYELMLNEIDCANERGRFSSMTINYDENAVVYWGPKSFSQWMKITPLSTMGILKDKVCGAGRTLKIKKK